MLASFVGAHVSAQTSSQWGDLRAGPFTVGFQVINRYDYSRTERTKSEFGGKPFRGERARPLQVWVWYPAQRTNASSMPYGEYVGLATEADTDRAQSPAEKAARQRSFWQRPPFASLPPDKIDGLMKWKTAARKEAPHAAGQFPLLVFGQGYFFESPATHSVLCEYLASHGYIVAAVPYRGYPLRESFHNLVGLEQEVRDMEYVIAAMHGFPDLDPDRLGAVGFDYGGMAALLLQMRNTDVDAVVGIDSGIMFRHNTAVLKQSPYYDVTNLRVPLMQITRPQAENGGDEDLSLFESAKYSTTYLVRIRGMSHEDFTSYGMISNEQLGDDPAQREKRMGYELTCRYILNFLDAYLKRSEQSLAYLNNRSETNGAPPRFLSVERRAARRAPPTERQFVDILLSEGIGRARQVYRDVKSTDLAYVLFREETLNLLGYQFLQEKRIGEAIEVFKLNREAYPQSWNAYDSLGEAYMISGDKEMAIRNYRKSLELNPQNTNAVEKLKKLLGG